MFLLQLINNIAVYCECLVTEAMHLLKDEVIRNTRMLCHKWYQISSCTSSIRNQLYCIISQKYENIKEKK